MSRDSRYRRRSPDRIPRDTVLVVCGGETERCYFEQLRQSMHLYLGHIEVRILLKPKSPMQIVQATIARRDENPQSCNQAWCVFDKDEFDCAEAFELARKNGICVAFSNQAFELWLIHHFQKQHAPLHRKRYAQILSRHLGYPYGKDAQTRERICRDICEEERIRTAITHAREALEFHRRESPGVPLYYIESVTSVHELVEALIRWAD